LTHIRHLGVKAGVALNPSTPVGVLSEVVAEIDHVLVMSVNPGFGGQKFIPHTFAKITAARQLLGSGDRSAPIEVDGGVEPANAAALVAAGAEILVAGASIFGQPDPAAAVHALRRAAEGGR
jgi:ribulose-phosphate 3-epimerase